MDWVNTYAKIACCIWLVSVVWMDCRFLNMHIEENHNVEVCNLEGLTVNKNYT